MLTVHPSSHESQRRHPHDTPRRAAPNRAAPHHTTPIPTRPTQPIPYHTTPHHTTTQPHCYLQRTAPTPPTTTFATATALNIVLVGIVHEPYSEHIRRVEQQMRLRQSLSLLPLLLPSLPPLPRQLHVLCAYYCPPLSLDEVLFCLHSRLRFSFLRSCPVGSLWSWAS